jgi:UDP-N-acetylmuramyl pentapeptide synthase
MSHLFCSGRDSRYTVESAKKAGLEHAQYFESKKALSEALASHLKPGDIVLFKGSRGVAIEDVISLIKDM